MSEKGLLRRQPKADGAAGGAQTQRRRWQTGASLSGRKGLPIGSRNNA